ncbi:uncharacterized protein LOC120142853 [Hibiscus syriacus]|uniref:uncharacterized protein LOC120142853 n=1 Tax=Hibiscus syriacus TaxID=106335 RepID=UPI00192417C9|nr:uncharacterized protein LOC120142853 [Hibiscus syriacus]
MLELDPSKAPGIDGFQAYFFQKNWEIVGKDVCQVVMEAFRTGCVPAELNRTLLVLIPKVASPENFPQFRPISLCTVLYKLSSFLRGGFARVIHSPYLFILCMERLANAIQAKVDAGRWKPIQLGRGGPRLSHLFFADDLVLFAEATMEQLQQILLMIWSHRLERLLTGAMMPPPETVLDDVGAERINESYEEFVA